MTKQMMIEFLRRRKKSQQGFTLIELLVVIAILGILAAIVSISLLGVTATAKNNALKAEKQVIQGAFDAMMADQHVDPSQLSGCENNPGHSQPAGNDPAWTDNMAAFPPGGAGYVAPDPTTGGLVTVLATHYIRERTTASAYYICDQEGNVYQKPK